MGQYFEEKIGWFFVLFDILFIIVVSVFSCFLSTGSGRKFGKTQATVSQTKVARAITVKDVIAVLEREPQMSKSTLIYRLYEKVSSDAAAAE